MGVQEMWVTSRDGTKLYAEAACPGGDIRNASEVIVLLHGLTGSTYIYEPIWSDSRLIRAQGNGDLSPPGRAVIRYDLRGHGKSDKPIPGGRTDETDTVYTAKTYAEDFAAVVLAFTGLDTSLPLASHRPLIVAAGWSVGCTHLVEVTRFFPGLLSSVVFIAPLPWPGMGRSIVTPAAMQWLPTLRGAATDDDGFDVDFEEKLQRARREWTRNFTSDVDALPQEMHENWYETAKLLPPAAAQRFGGRSDDAPGVQCFLIAVNSGELPLVHIHGTADYHIDCDSCARVLQGHIQGEAAVYEFRRIEGAGHSLMYDAPDDVVDAILSGVQKAKEARTRSK